MTVLNVVMTVTVVVVLADLNGHGRGKALQGDDVTHVLTLQGDGIQGLADEVADREIGAGLVDDAGEGGAVEGTVRDADHRDGDPQLGDTVIIDGTLLDEHKVTLIGNVAILVLDRITQVDLADLMLCQEAAVRQGTLGEADNGLVVVGLGDADVVGRTAVQTGHVVARLVAVEAVLQSSGIREKVIDLGRQAVREEQTGLNQHHQRADETVSHGVTDGLAASALEVVPDAGTGQGADGRMIQRRPDQVGNDRRYQLQRGDDEQVESEGTQIRGAHKELAAGRGHPQDTRQVGQGNDRLTVHTQEGTQEEVTQAERDLQDIDDAQNVDVQQQSLRASSDKHEVAGNQGPQENGQEIHGREDIAPGYDPSVFVQDR